MVSGLDVAGHPLGDRVGASDLPPHSLPPDLHDEPRGRRRLWWLLAAAAVPWLAAALVVALGAGA